MPLSRDEVASLAEGERILITWSGGNGPHEYTVRRDKYGNVLAGTKVPGTVDRWTTHPVDFVGDAKPFTVVERIKESGQRKQGRALG